MSDDQQISYSADINTSSSVTPLSSEANAQLIKDKAKAQHPQITETESETTDTEIKIAWYKSYKNWIKIALILFLVAIITLAIIYKQTTVRIFEGFLLWMIKNTAAGAFAFIGIYWFATVCMIPGSILTLGAGFVFAQVVGIYAGIFLATLVVFIGASLGAISAFILGRFVLREKVEGLKSKYPKFELIDKVIELNGLKVTFILRLTPLLPFNVFNYAMGLTSVTLRDYILALFGLLPGTLAYCFIGGTLGALADAGSVGFNNPVVLIITIVGTVLTLIGMVYIGWIAKKEFTKLAEQINNNSEHEIEASNVNTEH